MDNRVVEKAKKYDELMNGTSDKQIVHKTYLEKLRADELKNRKAKEKLLSYLEKWEKQLQIDGVNSKLMVRNDIQYLLNDLK